MIEKDKSLIHRMNYIAVNHELPLDVAEAVVLDSEMLVIQINGLNDPEIMIAAAAAGMQIWHNVGQHTTFGSRLTSAFKEAFTLAGKDLRQRLERSKQ